MDGLAFDCTHCKQRHAGLPALVYPEPLSYFILSDEGRASSILKPDYCIIEGHFVFLRCVLQFPIVECASFLEWGVWAGLSKTNFERYLDASDAKNRGELEAMPGLLDCPLKGYPDTLDLRCTLKPQSDRLRPLLVLDNEQDHPLVRDQMHGITAARAIELAMPFLHPQGRA